ncbi:hypothetical protein FKR81_19470 [Lentzea tibetensis]|uniref:Uncharacterized protein n=1 Tax=Lentzea tibetensis TaxID=2591470 RepID=A0A563ET53_9PSEU|nr:hypothetical protein [Lentzea tibetensis]TWP50782.1 hypothetical protein FKR81_19470 [Lentzea tibetensis]
MTTPPPPVDEPRSSGLPKAPPIDPALVARQPRNPLLVKLVVVCAVFAAIIVWVVIRESQGGFTDAGHAVAGDCAVVSGATIDTKYEKVDCGSGKENYVVGRELRKTTDSCGDEYSEYTKGSTKLCLIPVLVDGECYGSLFGTFLSAEVPKADCKMLGAFRGEGRQGHRGQVGVRAGRRARAGLPRGQDDDLPRQGDGGLSSALTP